MLTRKQQWRRVRYRPRQHAPAEALAAVDGDKPAKPHAGGRSCDDDEISTSTAFSTRSSFDSVVSSLEEEGGEATEEEGVQDEEGCGALSLPRPSPVAVDARGKGVTFEPRVQVFLVTHKSELDSRAKQALWWTGRDAAMNKRAWLNHLGQPGCGRQSAGRSRQHHQLAGPSSHLCGTSEAIGGRGMGGGGLSPYPRGGAGAGFAVSSGVSDDGMVGILGCRCMACLTEGDDHQEEQQKYDPYSAAYGHGYYPARAASNTWPSPDDWERVDGLEEKGSRSYSPAQSLSSSPMRDADEEGMFSASAYFWDRE